MRIFAMMTYALGVFGVVAIIVFCAAVARRG